MIIQNPNQHRSQNPTYIYNSTSTHNSKTNSTWTYTCSVQIKIKHQTILRHRHQKSASTYECKSNSKDAYTWSYNTELIHVIIKQIKITIKFTTNINYNSNIPNRIQNQNPSQNPNPVCLAMSLWTRRWIELFQFRGNIMVSSSACHAEDLGSIPDRGGFPSVAVHMGLQLCMSGMKHCGAHSTIVVAVEKCCA